MLPKLTPKQRLFCENYVCNPETFANGAQSYALAYGYDVTEVSKYKSAKTNAHKLLLNPAINAYINELLEDKKLTRATVDTQLDFLISQNANLGVKLQAIALFYKFRKEPAKEDISVLFSKREAELLARYVKRDGWEEWKDKYGHYFSSGELKTLESRTM